MPQIAVALALVRTAACALALSAPALASAQSLYDDPRPKRQFPPTLTPPPAAPVERLAFDCSASTRMDCAPKSVARERAVAPFVQRKPETAAK